MQALQKGGEQINGDEKVVAGGPEVIILVIMYMLVILLVVMSLIMFILVIISVIMFMLVIFFGGHVDNHVHIGDQ